MIPGVGRYSMLITSRAGSLFHAVFHTAADITRWTRHRKAEVVEAVRRERIPLAAAMRRWGISETNTASGSGFTIATARPGCARRGEDK